MANNAMDWTQSSASAFRQSNTNHFDSSHATDISYLLRDDASGHHSRSQYGVTNEYQPNQLGHNLHPGSQTTGLNIGEHFWPQQNDSSNNTPPQSEHLHNEPIHGHDSHQDAANDTASDQDEPVTDGPVRKKRTAVPRSERRKHYKPKPEPSDPRLFRPFAPNEAKNTMLAQWTTPPIVGTYVMFPNKQLKYNPVPPDLDQVREKLFKMDESVLLKNSQEVADYLPHITNFWRRVVQKHEADEETGVQYEYWYCRSKKSRKPAESVSKGIRNKAQKKVVLHEGKDTCKMRLRVRSFTKHANTSEDHEHWGGACRCVAEWVYLERDCVKGDLTEHTHDLEAMDEWKRSEGIAVFSKIKCEEGNSYSAVAKWFRKEFGNRNKQVFKFEKGDVANAAHPWRSDHKDLVLRDEVPEDSEEMITMRRCVDAMLEADASSLRAALREVCKDSDALTKVVLGVLEKNKPAAPVEEQPQEPWRLAEGVTLLDLPPPGVCRKVQQAAGVNGPLFIPPGPARSEYANSIHRGRSGHGRVSVRLPMGKFPIPLGPDGRPVIYPQAAPTRMTNPPHQTANRPLGPDGRPIMPTTTTNPPPQTANVPHAHSHAQQQSQSHALQPRPPLNAHGFHQPLPRVEVRYIQPPAGPPQQGSFHPITLTMEVPSCSLVTCKQCRFMDRTLAGRTFFFQDKLHTPSHFAKLERLLRDPKQLLHKDYTRKLYQPQVPAVHPHPALDARPVVGSAVGGVDVTPQVQQGGLVTASSASHAGQSPHIRELQRLSQSIQEALPEASRDIGVSTGESGESSQPTPQRATTSIHDMALPIASNVENGDSADADTDGGGDDAQQEQPPAKRQRLLAPAPT